jgi:hypothetical protein
MKFLGKTAKYALFNNKRNRNVMKELKIQPVLEEHKQLQTQIDTTYLQIMTPMYCYEISTSRKEEPMPPTEDFWAVILRLNGP